MKRIKRIACTLKPKTDDELNVFLEHTADAVDLTLPDISFLHRRRSAVHLTPGNAALLAGDPIASLEVNRNPNGWEISEELRSLYGMLEYDSKDSYFFTLHDAGWPNMLLRFRPEETYRDVFERLTRDEPMRIELIGELLDEIVFSVKGFRPLAESAFSQFYDWI